MKNILIIVDMQPGFSDSFDNDADIVKNIVQEIEKAKENNEIIIVLEYVGYGPTIEEIMSRLMNYEKRYIVNKDHNSGQGQIENLLYMVKRQCDLTSFYADDVSKDCNFKICGVNLDACVADTAFDLSRKYKKASVEIILGACNNIIDDFKAFKKSMMQNGNLVFYEGTQDFNDGHSKMEIAVIIPEDESFSDLSDSWWDCLERAVVAPHAGAWVETAI